MAWSLFLRWSGIPNNLHDCVQNEGHEKTYQLMIANMAMSDLLHSIFLFPWFVAGMYMYVDSWPVSGRLGPILCKLSWFFPCFCRRFNSRPDSHSSRSIQSRGFRLPRSSQQYKEVLLLNFGNLVVGYSNLLTILIWCETRFNGAKTLERLCPLPAIC